MSSPLMTHRTSSTLINQQTSSTLETHKIRANQEKSSAEMAHNVGPILETREIQENQEKSSSLETWKVGFTKKTLWVLNVSMSFFVGWCLMKGK